MATINVNIQISRTVATLDAKTIASVLEWVETNIKGKLSEESSLKVSVNIVP